MKTLRSYTSIILGLIKAKISLKLEYFTSDTAKTTTLLDTVNKFLELEKNVVSELTFSAEEAHIYGISIKSQTENQTQVFLATLGLAKDYKWCIWQNDTCTIVIK